MDPSFRKRLVIGQASVLLVLATAVATAILALRAAEESRQLVRGAQWAILIAGALGALLAGGVMLGVLRLFARQRERTRQAEVEAERAATARTELLAASDELRDPLERIVARCEQLRVTKLLDDAEQRELRAIEASARGVARKLGELLDVTAIQTGRISLDRKACSAASLVALAVEHHRQAALDRGIRLRTETPAATPVYADPKRVGHVLAALLGEAIAAARVGAEIVVGGAPSHDGVRFAISDVSPALPGPLGRAYGPAAVPSSKLDLLLCKRVIEAHGGRMGTEATETGHTYWFTMPTEPSLLR